MSEELRTAIQKIVDYYWDDAWDEHVKARHKELRTPDFEEQELNMWISWFEMLGYTDDPVYSLMILKDYLRE